MPYRSEQQIRDAAYIAAASPDRILALLAEKEALVTALRRFGRHGDGCSTVRIPGHLICDCGWKYAQVHLLATSPEPQP